MDQIKTFKNKVLPELIASPDLMINMKVSRVQYSEERDFKVSIPELNRVFARVNIHIHMKKVIATHFFGMPYYESSVAQRINYR